MALPSSPPAPFFPDTCLDLPSSPVLLPASTCESTTVTRKRPLSEYDNSSDPLFSDDPSGAEDVTGYDQPKRKRMLKGPWYALGGPQALLRPDTRAQRASMRNMDSGVWMGSESSDGSEREDSGDGPSRPRWPYGNGSREMRRAPKASEHAARRIIEKCVEESLETVDLSGLGLTELGPSTLKPLRQLIRQPHCDRTQPPSESEFVALTPAIQLFLAKNALTTLPAELFDLENITVLSLRSNALVELPTSIGKLRRLRELNVAGNQIRCLPWELLGLLSGHDGHHTVNVRPNPLVEPMKLTGPSALHDRESSFINAEEDTGEEKAESLYRRLRTVCATRGVLDPRVDLELRLRVGRILRRRQVSQTPQASPGLVACPEELVYLASSAVQFFGIDGVPSCTEDFSAHTTAVALQPEQQSRASRASRASHAAPSLFELAMRAIQEQCDLNDIPDALPTRVRAALQKAASGVAYGEKLCSTCQRPFVIARGEWVEYWFNGHPGQQELTQETILPFLRRACSWRCAVPSEVGTFRS